MPSGFFSLKNTTGAALSAGSRFVLLAAVFVVTGCSVFATRPVQEMSETAAAIRAAREAKAETASPELFRQANDWFFRARSEYKFKNFKLAKDFAEKARTLAEQAEFESIRKANEGGLSTEPPPPPEEPPPPPSETSEPTAYPTPEGTPAEFYDQRKAQEEAAKHPPAAPFPPTGAPGGTGQPPAYPQTIPTPTRF